MAHWIPINCADCGTPTEMWSGAGDPRCVECLTRARWKPYFAMLTTQMAAIGALALLIDTNDFLSWVQRKGYYVDAYYTAYNVDPPVYAFFTDIISMRNS